MTTRTMLAVALLACAAPGAKAATTVPNELKMPGTQPGEVSAIESPTNCAFCHGNYDAAVEPVANWQGSMMAHASGDPMFWAALAVAESAVDGAGDFCLRCHNPTAWLGGRSTPTDGSGLDPGLDTAGIACDTCHRLTNPDASEHQGVQNAPFVANDGSSPAEGFIGAGQYVVWNGFDKLGPYAAPAAPHPFLQSQFHRDSALCGTCHDVSNPFTGDLAPNNGAPVPLPPGSFSGVPGSAIETKAAFNNPPHRYGVVERTYSEHLASAWATLPVSDYATLPQALQGGAVEAAWQASQAAGLSGDYADGTTRTFSCQTCHMPATTGEGCSLSPPVRADLPLHDLTGANYWMPSAMQWLDLNGGLVIGGGYDAAQTAAMNVGADRARAMLDGAARISLDGNTLSIVNLTGHKLFTGYPEGRRMWLNIRWYDGAGDLVREDGAYGSLGVTLDGETIQVDTLLDLAGSHTKIYEVHGAVTQAWAQKLIDEVGLPGTLPLRFDRVTGAVVATLADAAALPAGEALETTHFVLNDAIVSDNRIPPYGFSYALAAERHALPVPPDQYGDPGSDGTYRYWDEVTLSPPAGAMSAAIALRYQPTSWEYVQFLHLANDGSIAHLADTGSDLVAAWRNTGMAAPHDIDTIAWTVADTDGDARVDTLDNCIDAHNPAQTDSDGDGFGNACDADFNNDGIVNFADLVFLKSVFLDSDPHADLNGDGIVNFGDLVLLKARFLRPPGPSGIAP